MIDAEQFNRIEDMATESVQELRTSIIKLMVKRIMAVDYNTLIESNRLLAYKLQSAGLLLDDIVKEVARLTGKSQAAVKQIFEDSYVQSVNYDNSIYEKYGIDPLPYNISEKMLDVLNDAMEQTNGEFKNMTRTLANSSQSLYMGLLDNAYIKVRSGSFSYEQAIADTVEEAIEEGAYIHYPSGHVDRIEVATRRAVLCGVNQSSIRAAILRCRENGWNHIIVSSHLGARTAQKGKPAYADHSAWQGKVYWLDHPDGEHRSFVDVCGWGTGDGIGGWGCRHSAFAWRPGMGNPFEQYDSEENKKRYELVSKQRAKERRIRDAKLKLVGLRTAIEQAEEPEGKQLLQEKYDKTAAKLKRYNKDYNTFCKDNGLKPYLERLKVAEWSSKESKRAVLAANRELRKLNDKQVHNRIYHFKGNNDSLFNGTLEEQAETAYNVTGEYCYRESKWKHKVIIDDEYLRKEHALAQKSWKCVIYVRNDTMPKSLIHEQLHARSANYLNRFQYIPYHNIEEGSVELLARQICIDKGISFRYTDNKLVNNLLRINQICNICDDDLSFAKLLFDKALPRRFEWLEKQADRYIEEYGKHEGELRELLKGLGI